MHNLFRMASLASLEGQLGKWPRMDRELLEHVPRGPHRDHRLPVGRGADPAAARPVRRGLRAAGEFRDIFGKENFFVELMDHGLDIERRVIADLLRLAEGDRRARWSPPTTCTTRARSDAHAHEVLLACSRARRSTSRRRPGGPVQVRRRRLLPASPPRRCGAPVAELPEACDNTLLIAERCEVEFTTGANYMPRFPVPDGRGRELLVRQGGRARPAAPLPGRRCPTTCARRPTTRRTSSSS